MAINNFGRYRNTETIIYDNKETYGRWVPPSFIQTRPSENLIGVYKVTSQTEGRPDLISHALYGNAQLDWVIIAFNNVTDVLNWPKSGDLIEYPLETLVLSELL